MYRKGYQKPLEAILGLLCRPMWNLSAIGRLSPLRGAHRLIDGISAPTTECRHKETPYSGSVGGFYVLGTRWSRNIR